MGIQAAPVKPNTMQIITLTSSLLFTMAMVIPKPTLPSLNTRQYPGCPASCADLICIEAGIFKDDLCDEYIALDVSSTTTPKCSGEDSSSCLTGHCKTEQS